MAIPDGYKIYWGATPDSLNSTHPTIPAYNSPIVVVGGDAENYTFPSDFWDNSFSNLYFSIVAYSDADGEGVMSKPVELFTCSRYFDNSEYGFSLPLNDGNTYTPKQLMVALGASRISIRKIGQSVFTSYLAVLPIDGAIIGLDDEILVQFASSNTITWRGRAWQKVS